MGSSPHSDWGTITVVWQDSKGGLQTYCYACDKWSNVDTTASADISTTNENDEENDEEGLRSSGQQSNINNKETCSLFVHVGDFLSLASIRGEGGYPMFPSPRHRVLSPIRRYDEDVSTSTSRGSSSYVKDYCRRSLVYFAYPPPNVTLNAVQQVVSSILDPPTSSSFTTQTTNTEATKGKEDDSKQQHQEGEKLYSNYSLLHNQSQQQQQQSASSNDMDNNGKEGSDEENKAIATYQHIKSIPFHEVIYDKWNQVQRGE